MSAAAEKEPTMEEILASIRRIISEDGADEDVSGPEASETDEGLQEEQTAPAAVDSDPLDAAPTGSEFQSEPEPEPEEPEPDFEEDAMAADAAVEDDVLELTEFAEPEDEPNDEPDPFQDDEAMGAGDADPDDDGALVSEPTEDQAGASFAELSAMLVGGYEGSGNTLEGLVRDMLKPMLRAWLDENLPRIVEDMVEREIARIAARKGRK